jgi:UDP-2,3-diacylglucosamine pyrophosphatase LpxH
MAAGPMDDGVLQRLGRMHQALHAWDMQVLQKPKGRLRKAQRELERTMNGPLSADNDIKAKELANLVEILLEQEEIYWSQRSRANWLQHGDHNTTFFHNFASARRKKNLITKLKNHEGDWVEGTEMLKPLILSYFTNLFTSEVQATDPAVLDKIQPRITDAMNERLLAPFTVKMLKKRRSV